MKRRLQEALHEETSGSSGKGGEAADRILTDHFFRSSPQATEARVISLDAARARKSVL